MASGATHIPPDSVGAFLRCLANNLRVMCSEFNCLQDAIAFQKTFKDHIIQLCQVCAPDVTSTPASNLYCMSTVQYSTVCMYSTVQYSTICTVQYVTICQALWIKVIGCVYSLVS